jgi:hypothetical protein
MISNAYAANYFQDAVARSSPVDLERGGAPPEKAPGERLTA